MIDEKQFLLLLQSIDAPKWTEITSTVVVIVSVLLAIGSILYARYQILGDHRRSQRQLAVELCIKWTEFSAPETSSVTRLIERLTSQQSDALAGLTMLEINNNQKHNLVNILQLRFPDIEKELENLQKGDFYQIEGQYLQYIRHIAVRYLNMLESILLAWAVNIADHEVIVSEFSYIFDETQNRTAMEEFRKKIGFEAFPSIALFLTALRERKTSGRSKVQRPPIVRNS